MPKQGILEYWIFQDEEIWKTGAERTFWTPPEADHKDLMRDEPYLCYWYWGSWFPKIEGWKKSQKNFQRDFTKLMLEYKGGSPEESICPPTWLGGLVLLGCFYERGTSKFVWQGKLLESGEFLGKGKSSSLAILPGNYVYTYPGVARCQTANYHHPGRLYGS